MSLLKPNMLDLNVDRKIKSIFFISNLGLKPVNYSHLNFATKNERLGTPVKVVKNTLRNKYVE